MSVQMRASMKSWTVWSFRIIAVMVLLSIYAWIVTPEGATVPTYYGSNGEPNQWASKSLALLSGPAAVMLISVIWLLFVFVLPRYVSRPQSMRTLLVMLIAHTVHVFIIVYGLLLAVHLAVILAATGTELNLYILTRIAAGVIVMVFGLIIANLRTNFYTSFGGPWTLPGREMWRKISRFGGKQLLFLGLATALGAFLGSDKMWLLLFVVEFLTVVATGTLYSYIVWRNSYAGTEEEIVENQPARSGLVGAVGVGERILSATTFSTMAAILFVFAVMHWNM